MPQPRKVLYARRMRSVRRAYSINPNDAGGGATFARERECADNVRKSTHCGAMYKCALRDFCAAGSLRVHRKVTAFSAGAIRRKCSAKIRHTEWHISEAI